VPVISILKYLRKFNISVNVWKKFCCIIKLVKIPGHKGRDVNNTYEKYWQY